VHSTSSTRPTYRNLARTRIRFSAMDQGVTALERAFQLAKSGKCHSVTDLKNRLRAEGYSTMQVTGRILLRQLEALIKSAKNHAQT
jgi:hypothetical protein